MDPLSITASVIALIQAVAVVSTGIQTICCGVQDVPQGVMALANEVSDFQALLVVLNAALGSLKDPQCENLESTISYLEVLVKQSKKHVKELEDFLDTVLTKYATRGGRLKAALHFTKESDRLEKIRYTVREDKLNFVGISSAIGMIQSHTQTRILLNVQEVAVTTSRQTATLSTTLERQVAELSQYQNETRTETFVKVRTSIMSQTCSQGCTCQCHVRVNLRTPRWLVSTLGILFYRYSGSPFLIRPPSCNEEGCKRNKPLFSQVSYFFPQWAFARALCLTVNYTGLQGRGATLSVRTPRVLLQDDEVWRTINLGSLPGLQQLLVARTVTPFDILPDGESLLLRAFRVGKLDLCKLLLHSGADQLLEDSFGRSTATEAYEEVVTQRSSDAASRYKFLYEGTDIDDRMQLTELHQAVIQNDAADHKHTEIFKFHSSINETDCYGQTPLAWAVRRNDASWVTTLLKWGADSNTVDDRGITPLHWAAVSANLPITEALLGHSADPNKPSSSGWTPLHWCVTNEFKHSIDVVERLLASGADLNSHKGEESESPLVVAVKYGKMKNVEYLVQHGADMEAPDHWGKTPVIHAVLLNKPHILRVLLGSGANLKSVLPDGRTVLHCAASSAGPEVMELLAQSGGGVDLDAKDGIGHTATDYFSDRYQGNCNENTDFDGTAEAFQKLVDAYRSWGCDGESSDNSSESGGTLFFDATDEQESS